MSNETNLIPPRDVEVANIRKELTIDAADVKRLKDHKKQIKRFVQDDLEAEVDYTTLNGRVDKFLTKAGAEKLKMLFGLGVRFETDESILDRQDNFALYSYKAIVTHAKTGLELAECIGVCNSQEVKYREKRVYQSGVEIGKEPVPVCDILNTLKKMAQKRAFVGAIILAVGASDYLTQDDDEVTAQEPKVRKPVKTNGNQFVKPKSDAGKFVIPFGKHQGKKLEELEYKEAENYIKWCGDNNQEPKGAMKELIDKGREYLRESSSEQ